GQRDPLDSGQEPITIRAETGSERALNDARCVEQPDEQVGGFDLMAPHRCGHVGGGGQGLTGGDGERLEQAHRLRPFLSDEEDTMRHLSVIALIGGLAGAALTGGSASAGMGEVPHWRVVIGPDIPVAGSTYGGVCSVGVNHRIAKDVYPRTIYFSGGARCTSGDKPAVVFQDA